MAVPLVSTTVTVVKLLFTLELKVNVVPSSIAADELSEKTFVESIEATVKIYLSRTAFTGT